MKLILLIFSWALSGCNLLHAQGTFRNLDFEATMINDLPSGVSELVSVQDGLPGWSAHVGSSQMEQILHNGVTIGTAAISIFGPSYFPQEILQGRYSVGMRGGSLLGEDVSLSQTGQIPENARSLIFLAQGTPSVSLGGNSLALVPLQETSSGTPGFVNTLFGADITRFAGQQQELAFTAAAFGPSGFNSFILDSIRFSTFVVPEPTTSALLLGGIILFVSSAVFNRKR